MIPIARPNLVFISFEELFIHYGLTVFTIIVYVWWLYNIFTHLNISVLQALTYIKNNLKRVVKNLVIYALLQKKLIKNRYAGIMHYFIAFGIFFLAISTFLVFLDNDILSPIHIRILIGAFYLGFEAYSDLAGLMLITGIGMAFYRRLRKKVLLETIWDDYIILTGLLIIALEGFFLEALNIYLTNYPFDIYRFVGVRIAAIYGMLHLSTTEGVIVYQWFWAIHFITVFAVLCYAPFSKLSHTILSSLYVGVAYENVRGAMSTPFNLEEVLATGTFDIQYGLKENKDLTPIKRLEYLACTNCGRCERACPAFASGADLSPRVFMQNLKKNFKNTIIVVPALVSENAIWACTTCQACVEECPVLLDPQSFILESRRAMVLESKLDKEKVNLLNNLTYTKNPLGSPPSDRNVLLEHAEKFDGSQEYLYWVGCMASLDPRSRETALALIKLLKQANISFGILGEEEQCCGAPARRLGEEGRYQELVLNNIATFRAHNVRKLIVSCPHGYSTFKSEYIKFGFEGEVYHHSEILKHLINTGKIKVAREELAITYHDPCYLGRINNGYDNPRFILNNLSSLIEMERSREKSFCCGAGGTNYWYKVEEKTPISHMRLKEAMSTGASTVAVACPYCLTMLEDAARTMGVEEKVKIKDISELVAEHLTDK